MAFEREVVLLSVALIPALIIYSVMGALIPINEISAGEMIVTEVGDELIEEIDNPQAKGTAQSIKRNTLTALWFIKIGAFLGSWFAIYFWMDRKIPR
ncbi:MAG: hypothetical protein V3T58_02955 [Candidatus Hydrothermarchaeales archaeon]